MHSPNLRTLTRFMSPRAVACVAALLVTIALAAGAFTYSILSAGAEPGARTAVRGSALADAAREARYVLTAVDELGGAERAAGAAYVASSLERLRNAADASGDSPTTNLVAALPRNPTARPEATTALLDAIAARAERLATIETIESDAHRRAATLESARFALGLSGLASFLTLGLIFMGALAWSRYRTSIAQAIPADTPGATDADRVGFLSGRLNRARQLASQLNISRDEISDALTTQALDNRAYRDLVERRASQIRELELALLKDDMTGLWRFSHLQKEVKIAIEAYQSERTPFCVVALDLNKFKAINETYGHKAGDQAIRDVGEILASASRSTDVSCRRGGDEFMLLLPKTSREDGLAIANRIRTEIGIHRVLAPSVDGHVDFSISTTAGLFYIGEADTDELGHVADDVEYADNRAITHVTRAADSAQEYAKYQGSDRVFEYTKDVDEYLGSIELPPRWDHFVRHAGRVFQRLTGDVRTSFLASYESLVELTLSNSEPHTAQNNQEIH